MNKPKIFLVSPMLHQGGFEKVCVTTARILADKLDITIVIFDDKDIAFDIEGLKVVNLNLGVKSNPIARITNVFKRAAALKKLKKEYAPKVCYSFGSTANMVNAMSKTKETKIWLGIRGYDDVLYEKRLSYICRKADLVVSCSEQMEDIIHKMYPQAPIDTLNNPFDVRNIEELAKESVDVWPFKDSTKVIISAGRDHEVKHFWHMIKAFKLLNDEFPDTGLVLMGEGDFSKSKNLCANLGLTDKVFFAGLQRNPYKYLTKADIYLLTSRNEGFPNAMVEGMCLGLACVSTDCLTGPKEILKNGEVGFLTPVMSPKENYDAGVFEDEEPLARILKGLVGDEDRLADYKQRAKKRAADFSYESYCTKFMYLFNKETQSEETV